VPHAAERAGDDAACLRLLGVVLELFLVKSRHICLGVEIDLLDRRRTVNDAQVDMSGRVEEEGGWPASLSARLSAIEKQAACAAASSSSGLVPSPCSNPGKTSAKRDRAE
jgi:hypothetical protein